MKKLIAMILCGTMLLSLAACGTKTPSTTTQAPTTTTQAPATTTEAPTSEAASSEEVTTEAGENMGEMLKAIFEAEIAKTQDLEAILTTMQDKVELMTGIMDAEPGYLNGFDDEVKGFKSGKVLLPMIGAQPFVAYIFVADDAAAFLDTLNKQANPRWNICTEADAPVYAVSGNYVFYTMCPKPMEF